VASIGKLWTELNAAGLQDRVTFATINVFGRTLSAAKGNGRGRTHHGDHHVAVLIGKPFKGGVVGGVEPADGDYRATSIDATSGRARSREGVGTCPSPRRSRRWQDPRRRLRNRRRRTSTSSIRGGKVVTGALAP